MGAFGRNRAGSALSGRNISALFAGRIAAFAACLMLAACAKDTTLTDLRAAAPKPGLARIVVLYPAPLLGDNGLAQVRYNQGAYCDLPSGSYTVRELEPGAEKLAFSFCGAQAATSLLLETEADGKYYLRILPYDSSLVGILSGYPNENPPHSRLRTRKPPTQHGPFQVEILDEKEAFRALADLKPSAVK